MSNVYSAPIEHPEWYVAEKNTERVINKLTTIKELSFYLNNPDEYIRRLAIIRICNLKSKEFIDVLKELLDDPLESSLNKELSAWAIKAISLKCNIDIFINHKLLNKYSGDEKFNDIFKLDIIENLPSIRYNFSSGLLYSELQQDSRDILQSKDIVFDTHFNLLQWACQWVSGKFEYLKIILLSLPANVRKLIKLALNQIREGALLKVPGYFFLNVKKIFGKLNNVNKRKEAAKKMIGEKENVFSVALDTVTPESLIVSKPTGCVAAKDLISDFHSKHYSYHVKKTRRKVLGESLKAAAISFLCFVFYPLRLLLKHRFFSAACLLVAYFYLTYTTSGKIFTYKNFGLDLLDMQNHLLNNSSEILSFIIWEINDIAGWALSKFIG